MQKYQQCNCGQCNCGQSSCRQCSCGPCNCEVGVQLSFQRQDSCHRGCNHQTSTHTGLERSVNDDIYRKVANTLEFELKKQKQDKECQIDDLREEISKMRVHIMKLQARNKLDRNSEDRIQSELTQLKIQHSQHSSVSSPEEKSRVHANQIVRQVFVPQDHTQKDNQLRRLKDRNKELQQQNAKFSYQLQRHRNQNNEIVDQWRFQREKAEKYKLIIQECQDQINRLKNKLVRSQEIIGNLQETCSRLQANSHKVKIVETQKIVYKPQIKVQTVYIQKPIEKLVYVDVPRIVKQFIQPQQPIVNRIIDCNQKCKCDQAPHTNYQQSSESVEELKLFYQDSIRRLENNIDQYQKQRDRLVEAIKDRDIEYNQLQQKMRLAKAHNSRTVCHSDLPSIVTVTVHKENQNEKVGKKDSTHPRSTIKAAKTTAMNRGPTRKN